MQNTNQIYAHIFMIRKFESLQMDFYRIIKNVFFSVWTGKNVGPKKLAITKKKRRNPFDRFLIAKYKNRRSRNKKKRKPSAHETILNLKTIKKA